MSTVKAAAWAAALGGAPSTLHALVTGRDPLEATLAAGTILRPQETRRGRLLAAAVPVHLGLSLAWAVALDRAGVRRAGAGALAGMAIAALDLGLLGRRRPRIRALPLLPQLADHVLYGAVVGAVLGGADPRRRAAQPARLAADRGRVPGRGAGRTGGLAVRYRDDMPRDAPSEAAQTTTCPHCRKTFAADLIAGGPQRHRGFKCPHCKLFVPESRAEDSPLSRDG